LAVFLANRGMNAGDCCGIGRKIPADCWFAADATRKRIRISGNQGQESGVIPGIACAVQPEGVFRWFWKATTALWTAVGRVFYQTDGRGHIEGGESRKSGCFNWKRDKLCWRLVPIVRKTGPDLPKF